MLHGLFDKLVYGKLRAAMGGNVRYAVVTRLPEDRILSLPAEGPGRLTLLETGRELQGTFSDGMIRVALPAETAAEAIPVVKME